MIIKVTNFLLFLKMSVLGIHIKDFTKLVMKVAVKKLVYMK